MPGINEAFIRIRVSPRSSANQVAVLDDGIYKVKLTAPPVDGKANRALRQFLAKKLRISKTSVEIVSGEKGREKLIKIHGLSDEAVNERLAEEDETGNR